MKILKELEAELGRPLHELLLRRAVAWLASSTILFSLGTATAALVAAPKSAQLGIIMAVFSLLPAFLLWPPPSRLLILHLRALDEASVIEAYLEAPPGTTRSLLKTMARDRARMLAGPSVSGPPQTILWPPPLLRGLGPLVLAALFSFFALQIGSILVLKRPLIVYSGREVLVAGMQRSEEERFGDFQGMDNAARRAERDQDLALGGESEQSGEGTGVAGSGERPTGVPGARRPRADTDEVPLPNGGSSMSTQEKEGLGPDSSGQGASSQGQSSSQGENSEEESAPGQSQGKGSGRSPTSLGRTGQGYEKTGDTGVPSPLLDYKSKFVSVFAERTGKRISAGDEIGLGELRDYERRYFASFTLSAGIAPAEEPYAALLKKRWREIREGVR